MRLYGVEREIVDALSIFGTLTTDEIEQLVEGVPRKQVWRRLIDLERFDVIRLVSRATPTAPAVWGVREEVTA